MSSNLVTLQVSKDGAAVGRLALSLRSATQRCLVGRHPDCDVHLEHLSISRHHAELTLDHAGHLFLTDLGAGDRSGDILPYHCGACLAQRGECWTVATSGQL